MKKRYALFGMTALLAVTLAVPAFGGPSNAGTETFASAKKTAKKALKKANAANKAAGAAQSTADGALTAANGARTLAQAAQTSADQANTAAAAAQTAAEGAQATADSKFGSVTQVTGETSLEDSTSPKILAAGCVAAGGSTSGGGYFMNGAGRNDVSVVFSSQFFNGWLAIGEEIGAGTAQNWSLTATVNCIDQ